MLKGTLSEGALPGVFRQIYLRRETGLLRFDRAGERCQIGIVNGHITYGASTIRNLRLGEVMVAHGRMTGDDLERASEIVLRERRRLGQVLLDLNVVDENGLEDALALHAREVLLEVFSWTEGEYSLDAHLPDRPRGHDQPLRLSTGEVILDAVWSIRDRDLVRYALGDVERTLLLSADPLLRFQRITLTPTDAFVLSRVDGTLSARDILGISPAGEEETERSLLGLLCTGMVEYLPPAPPAADKANARHESLRQEILEVHRGLAGKDHHEVLGVAAGATLVEIKTAYFRLVKRYHPDIHHDRALTDLVDKLEAIFQRLNTAYRALSEGEQPQRPAAAAASPAPIVESQAPPAERPPLPGPGFVEDLCAKAKERLDEGRHWEAVALLGEAVPLATGALRLRARVMLARAYRRVAGRVKEAEKELRAVLDEDPRHAEACLLLAGIFRDAGLTARAAGLYQKVLDQRPENAEAKAALAALAPEPSRPPRGALRRLLRRT